MFKRRYLDTDRLVERRAGHSISYLFRNEGEASFRELETKALESLASERSLLVSCGGGIVETPRNIELMHEMGVCVYLDGEFDDSLRQIRSLASRLISVRASTRSASTSTVDRSTVRRRI